MTCHMAKQNINYAPALQIKRSILITEPAMIIQALFVPHRGKLIARRRRSCYKCRLDTAPRPDSNTMSGNRQTRRLVLVASVLSLAAWWPCDEVHASATDAASQHRDARRAAAASGGGAGMWFGPRLGRRLKRNLQLSNAQLARQLVDLVEEAPWLLLAVDGNDLVTEGKRHTVNFTPRLGRESGEDAGRASGGVGSLLLPPGSASSDRWLIAPAAADQSPDLMAQRSPPFAPRLGRARY